MLKHLVGSHVSAEKGVHEAIPRILTQGGLSFSIFLKNQKRWSSAPYEKTVIQQFRIRSSESHIDTRKQILPHGSYMINLGNPDAEKLEKSKNAMLDDLQRCEQLDIGLYNFHPGSSLGSDKKKAIEQIAASINSLIEKTEFVKIVLENMTGNEDRIVGTKLEDLQQIIELVEDKDRIGVCIDTCHTFAAGYDLRTGKVFDEFWDKFEKIIGWQYLAGIHLNDSKHPYDSKRDVHQNLGLGFLGLEPFRMLMNNERFEGIPLILETPQDQEDIRKDEIELLKWCVGKEGTEQEFIEKVKDLQEKGRKEREAVEEAAKKKENKTLKRGRGKQTTIGFDKKVKT